MLDVRRYYHDSGRLAGDMVFDVTSGVDGREVIIDPADDLRQKKLSGLRFETLLKPLARNGKSVLDGLGTSALAAQARAKEGLACLDESQLRMLNPHTYPVGLDCKLFEVRRSLVSELRDVVP